MKKHTDLGVYFLAFLVVLVTLTLAARRFSGPPAPETVSLDNGVQAEGHAVTVSRVQSVPHKSYAILRGDIVESLGREHYTFRDSTGETAVKIKDKHWGGLTAGPSDGVEILVEIKHKKDGRIEAEAKSMREI